MTTLQECAFAKINLTLDILGRRADGFHDLETVMQAVSLCDEVEVQVETGTEWSLTCETEGVPCDSRNLAWKAAELFQQESGWDLGGVSIRIVKRIPSQAGMGGGSADAAAVLRALNRWAGEPYSPMELADLGAKIGSDVPFCVVGGTHMCKGRGERMRPLRAMPRCTIVVAKPDFGVSTPALFRAIDDMDIPVHPDNAAMEQALEEGNLPKIGALLSNMFDIAVSREHPEMDHIRDILASCGALGQQMTGSGSAFFGIMPDEASAERAAALLREHYSCVFVCETV